MQKTVQKTTHFKHLYHFHLNSTALCKLFFTDFDIQIFESDRHNKMQVKNFI